MATNFFDSYDNNINTNCTYVDLSSTNLSFNDYIVDLNVCSLKNKVSELEGLITLLNFPKAVCCQKHGEAQILIS